MPPSGPPQGLRARDEYSPPVSLNIPVVGLVVAFAMLFLVCIGICCCSYRKTARRNERYQQLQSRADSARVGFTQPGSPLTHGLSSETDPAVKAQAARWSVISRPPAYSTVSPVMFVSPEIPQTESERLLPPTPMTPRVPSPPPPTYSAAK